MWSVSATSQLGQRRETPQARQWTAGATPRRLSRRIARPPLLHDPAERAEQRRRERVARLAPQVDQPHGGQRGPDARGERRAGAAAPSSPAAGSPTRTRRRRPRAPPAWPRPCVRRSAGRTPACTRCRAPRRRRSARRPASARTRPSGRRRRSAPRRARSGRARRAAPRRRARSAGSRPGRRTAARKRPTVWGASAISGTSTIVPRPRSSAAAHAWRYTSVLPLPVGPSSRT